MALKAELKRKDEELQAAQKQASKIQKTHDDYKKRNRQDKKGVASQVSDGLQVMQSELTRTQLENEALKATGASVQGKKNCKNAYIEILDLVHAALDKMISTVDDKFANRASVMIFEWGDAYGAWTRVTDDMHLKVLTQVYKGEVDNGSYTIESETYKVCRKPTAACKTVGTREVCMEQTNTTTKTTRDLCVTSGSHLTREAIGMQVLFSEDADIDLPADFVARLQDEHSFQLSDQVDEISLSVATIAEKLASLTDTIKYCNPEGNKPKRATKPTTVTCLHGVEFCSELWVKPHGLHNWLRLASARGYTKMRLFCHGSRKYGAFRADMYGFDMAKAQGQAFGNGIYGGMSWHATRSHNGQDRDTLITYPPGTYIMGLHLVVPTQGWQHRYRGGHRGAYTNVSDDEVGKLYKSISYDNCSDSMDNAIVVHDPSLIVPLGWARSWSPEYGWEH